MYFSSSVLLVKRDESRERERQKEELTGVREGEGGFV
jgi:hypothetical protein